MKRKSGKRKRERSGVAGGLQAGDGSGALRENLVPDSGMGRAPGSAIGTGSVSEERGDREIGCEQHAAVPTGLAGSVRSGRERVASAAVDEKSVAERVYAGAEVGAAQAAKD